jgi:hypothetical protein
MAAMTFCANAGLEKEYEKLEAMQAAYEKKREERNPKPPEKSANDIRKDEIYAELYVTRESMYRVNTAGTKGTTKTVLGQASGSSSSNAMHLDADSSQQQDMYSDDLDDGPGDGGGFD